MNKGLSPELNWAFPHINIKPLQIEARPNKIPSISISSVATVDESKENANWMAGFAKGEGSFQVDIRKSQTTIMSMGQWVNGSMAGYQVLLRFSIGQHRRDQRSSSYW